MDPSRALRARADLLDTEADYAEAAGITERPLARDPGSDGRSVPALRFLAAEHRMLADLLDGGEAALYTQMEQLRETFGELPPGSPPG